MAARIANLQPSKMARKFLTAEPLSEGDLNRPYNTFRKEHYFFYGTLMDPGTLAKVLNLRDRPKLLPARVIGYRCMLWGPYPALLDSPGTVVEGMAYEVQTPEEVERLQAYETNHYERAACLIQLRDGKRVIGRTFRWSGIEEELKEGAFDLKDWQMNNLERSCYSEMPVP